MRLAQSYQRTVSGHINFSADSFMKKLLDVSNEVAAKISFLFWSHSRDALLKALVY